MRWQFYMVRVGNKYKVGRYGGEVLITLISVLVVTSLAVIYVVIYIYIASNLKLSVLLVDLN